MYQAFERRGYETRIYAGSWDFTEPQAFPVSDIDDFLQGPDDLLIFHYSIAWEPGIDLLQRTRCHTALKYHNITPPHFFSGVSPWHEEKCHEGLEELKVIAHLDCDLFLGDSEFNLQDLIAQGVSPDRCFVVPPFHHIDRLESIDADLETLDSYRDGKTNILMVGRVSPNKGHLDLVEAFAIYHHDYNPNSRLLIVGKQEDLFEPYTTKLREATTFLLSESAVEVTGEASDSELKAYYLLAHVFAIASEHEGFCVPLLEAMAMKVPVVAYSSSAIPSTLGGAGLLLEERNPKAMAEAIDRLVNDEILSVAFGMNGWRRYQRYFTNGRIEADLFTALSNLSATNRRTASSLR
jgi:glycosyltransferase involved in cell wall biosynthesis